MQKRTCDEGIGPRSCRFACIVYKVIGVTYINRPGAFLYPSPMGIIQCYLASYRAKSKASFFFQPSCKAS